MLLLCGALGLSWGYASQPQSPVALQPDSPWLRGASAAAVAARRMGSLERGSPGPRPESDGLEQLPRQRGARRRMKALSSCCCHCPIAPQRLMTGCSRSLLVLSRRAISVTPFLCDA